MDNFTEYELSIEIPDRSWKNKLSYKEGGQRKIDTVICYFPEVDGKIHIGREPTTIKEDCVAVRRYIFTCVRQGSCLSD